MKATIKRNPPALAPDEADDSDITRGGVDRTECDYSIFGTSRRKDFIFKVR
jgi:hypothetical protein